MNIQKINYEQDIAAWAMQQAGFIREKKFEYLDLVHLSDEIEAVSKSEQRELANRMILLLAHLLKWTHQPAYRSASWEITIRNQRRALLRHLAECPSLQPKLDEPEWWISVWEDAVAQAAKETGLADFPEQCPWQKEEVLSTLLISK